MAEPVIRKTLISVEEIFHEGGGDLNFPDADLYCLRALADGECRVLECY